jgi:signal peptidase I
VRRGVALVALAAAAPAALASCGDGNETTIKIPSAAMAPTYKIGDTLKVDRDVGTVKLDDAVVVYPPTGALSDTCGAPHSKTSPCPRSTPSRSKERFVKRVVAGPGQSVAFVRGRVVLNRKPAADPHANTGTCPEAAELCNLPKPVTVPAGDYFVVGDNRGESDDSRSWGPVPKAWIYGKVTGKE